MNAPRRGPVTEGGAVRGPAEEVDEARNDDTAPGDFRYASDELDALAGADNYYGAVLDAFRPHLGASVVEVGAGVGTFAARMVREVTVQRLTLIEPARNNLPLLRARFRDEPRVSARPGYLAEHCEGLGADALVAVNVLEHVADDRAFLRDARTSLRPGGALLLYVPAIPWIFGSLDTAFEHHRRYTRRGLELIIRAAGFDVLRAYYTNLPGVLSWFVAGRVLRRRTIFARDVQFYDRCVMPWVVRMERWMKPPFGQSLVAIARRPA